MARNILKHTKMLTSMYDLKQPCQLTLFMLRIAKRRVRKSTKTYFVVLK